jgi:hypothetical protein
VSVTGGIPASPFTNRTAGPPARTAAADVDPVGAVEAAAGVDRREVGAAAVAALGGVAVAAADEAALPALCDWAVPAPPVQPATRVTAANAAAAHIRLSNAISAA